MEKQPKGLEREHFAAKRIVVKIGSSTITEGATCESPLNLDLIDDIAMQCSVLFKSGLQVAIVSSGAVACGKHLLGTEEHSIRDRQVEAVFGQNALNHAWVQAFNKYGVNAGEMLLREEDLVKPLTTLKLALKKGPVVINNNDATSDREMKQLLFSADNDRISGFVAISIGADTIIILTDVEGVKDKDGSVIEDGSSIDETVVFDIKSEDGTGGMVSKIDVLRKLANLGIKGIITSPKDNIILDVAAGRTENKVTTFNPPVYAN